ncbi:MAG: cobalt ECF transporter T component CbiQ [Spirochaetaceae bacterium]|nr:MAG: cobalt ECF transporter T component CbiQ [Spirochaetaceae bacterium]
MEFERYAHLDSPVHAWNPRFKLTAGFLLMLVCASINKPSALAAAAFGALVLIGLSRLPLRFVIRMLKAPLLLLVLMLPVLILTAGGEALWSWRFLNLYRDGLTAAARIAVKSLTVILLFVGFFATVRLNTALQSLENLKVPSILLTILLFTYRYIFLYLEDSRKLLTAARLRGYNLQRGLRHVGVTAGILVTLLLRSYEQSERVAAAMRLRGFDGRFHSLERLHRRPLDLLAVVLTAVWVCLLLWLELR